MHFFLKKNLNTIVFNKKNGLTLIELLVVITIIAVLSAIAIPSFQKQLRLSRTSEAVGNLGIISMYQENFMSENSSYISLPNNPSTMPHFAAQPRLNFESQTNWDLLGQPIPVGSPVYFQYSVIAGQIDESGNAVSSHPFANADINSSFQAHSSHCDNPTYSPSADLNISNNPSSNWYIISASADQGGTAGQCSLFIKTINRKDLFSRQRSE